MEFQYINTIIENLFMTYAITILISYVVLAVASANELARHNRISKITNYDAILSSPFAPQISLVAPAYNESLTIVDNIKALLGLYYPSFEIIIINDGSKDNTLQKTIEAFDLEKVPFVIDYKIQSNEVLGVYKSKKKAYSNLTVIDKINGGKADALNAGINIANSDYFVAIDVDSVIDRHALNKLIKPFFEETDKKVIAVGGVIQIANGCKIEDGQLVEVNVPDKLLPRIQIIEYTRTFLFGRMGWSKLDGLLLISGALGLFDKQVVIECGGYYSETVGEDMELVVRMREYMANNKQKYKVIYIPDPLCWTESPSSLKILGRQRNRWTRGTIDTIFLHRKIFFNRKYGFMGLVSHPYWVFFEWLAPVVEVSGLIYFILLAILGQINWPFFLVLASFMYFFTIFFSIYAILLDHLTYHRYKKRKMLIKLILAAFLEPFIYHPLMVYWGIRGNFDYFIRKKKTWGTMTRTGFSKSN